MESYKLALGSISQFSKLPYTIGLALLVCLGTVPAWSQATSNSALTGQVTDQQNAGIPGAQVKITDRSTGAVQEVLTNDTGRYLFASVSPGDYIIQISKQGFNNYKVGSQHVDVGTTITVNAVLDVGTTATTVEVTGTIGAELQTTSSTVGNTMSGDSLMNLPNMGRDVATLAVLQPAVSPPSPVYGSTSGFTAGAFNDSNTYMLDGGNITDDMAGQPAAYQTDFAGVSGTQTNGAAAGVIPTPVESIEEVKVQVFNQTADFNNSSGANVQMVTKRGTNTYHGSLYDYYFATNVGAANNWTNNHTPCNPNVQSCDLSNLGYTPLPSNHRERFGGSIGGQLTPFKSKLGKWYGFFNYEGMRYPNVGTFETAVPTPALRAGVIQIPNASGVYQSYNLGTAPVTVNGAALPPSGIDPRGLGISPVVSKIWNSQMPLPNDPNYGGADGYNTQGFLSQVRAPLTTNNYISRLDHDFGDKWHWMASYRFTRLVNLTTNQVDIGGVFPGDTLGTPAPTAPRPQNDSYFVTGLTTNITANMTNSVRFSYLRQYWAWGTQTAPPQLAGLGGAVEMVGTSGSNPESALGTNGPLIPYNVNSQSVRQRFWDGHDTQVADDLTMLHGNHVFQYGASYQRNNDYHMRTDNGVNINNQIVYWLGNYGQENWNGFIPSSVPAAQDALFENLFGAVTGMVAQTQVAYTRAGANLNLQPLGSNAYEHSIIPYYNVYFSDTWRVRPSFTFTYGLAYALEMPPYELNGAQVTLVDSNNQQVNFNDYIAQRQKAALQGTTYDPTLGYALVGNVGGGLKYPYHPFYGEFSPRVSIAWNPAGSDSFLGRILGDHKTVLRAGYGRIYGRINGVNQVLVPLLGPGILQGVACNGIIVGSTGCAGTGVATPANAFRIGNDGMVAPLPAASATLPQPFYPGGTTPNAGDATTLDPNYRPNRTDNVDVSLQRQLTNKMMMEVGYIGRISRNDFMEVNLDAVPYMETLNGQSFAQAYANLWNSLCGGTYPCTSKLTGAQAPMQPFFEAALGGTSSKYCAGFSSCTAAFATAQLSNIQKAQVSTIWGALNTAAVAQNMAWAAGRTMISSPLNGGNSQATSALLVGSYGWSNYNALYLTWRTSDWHGLTASSNFTWSRALGTAEYAQLNSSITALDAYDIGANYGPQLFDFKFVYNASMYYSPPFLNHLGGWKGRVLGGWTISPLFTAYSGPPINVSDVLGSFSQGFGESTSSSISSPAERAVGQAPYSGSSGSSYGVSGSGGIGTNNPYGANFYSNPAAAYAEFRPCIVGMDTSCGGYGNIRGLPQWGLDTAVSKDIGIIRERVGATLMFSITNVMNHNVLGLPSLALSSPTLFGRITSQGNTPRNMEFGLRIHF